jgi:hypothetical protein
LQARTLWQLPLTLQNRAPYSCWMFPLLDATRLAKFRDWIIVAGGLSYLLGFLVVASYSTWQGLGIIKALDTQYIVAGLLPSALIAVAYMVAKSLKGVADAHSRDIQDAFFRAGLMTAIARHDPKGDPPASGLSTLRGLWSVFRPLWGSVIVRVLVFGALLQVTTLLTPLLYDRVDDVFLAGLQVQQFASVTCLFLLMIVFYLVLLNFASAGQLPATRGRGLVRPMILTMLVFFGCFPVAVAVVMVVGYVKNIYPKIPTEFGGPASTCVRVVFKDPRIGNAIGTAPAGANEPQLHKMTLELAGDPYVLSTPNGIWQIARDEVRAMVTCDQRKRY